MGKISKKLREKICEKYSFCCVVCDGWLYNEPWGVHHLKKRSQGGEDTLENLVPCHNKCNSWIEDFPREARRRGFVIKSWENP